MLYRDISIIRPQDGRCMVTCQTASWMLQAANGNVESVDDGWGWQRLTVLPNGEVRATTQIWLNCIYDVFQYIYQPLLLLACAGRLLNTNTTLDSETDPSDERAHAYIYELFFNDEQGSYDARLEPLGHWSIDGSVESVALHREADGKSCLQCPLYLYLLAYNNIESISFIYVNREGQFIAQTIRILPRALPPVISQSSSRAESPGLGSRLPLSDINVPNPFKRQKSSDGAPLLSNDLTSCGPGRVVLGDLLNGGALLGDDEKAPIKMRFCFDGQKLTACIWGTEFLVRYSLQRSFLAVSD